MPDLAQLEALYEPTEAFVGCGRRIRRVRRYDFPFHAPRSPHGLPNPTAPPQEA
ncbi:hypothetical protein STVIR_1216 [Streptomyces viridochromogenes Tue57]|uniref:Uncharacterized protein n=1 Tax=Streptomyces viridochromogenes Tue57 TaxID=1160705 RepID=L8PQX5_STRVR|nr:hypothetical protein STVIR_1216 [Streptomyces viridochromogenes Tue57]